MKMKSRKFLGLKIVAFYLIIVGTLHLADFVHFVSSHSLVLAQLMVNVGLMMYLINLVMGGIIPFIFVVGGFGVLDKHQWLIFFIKVALVLRIAIHLSPDAVAFYNNFIVSDEMQITQGDLAIITVDTTYKYFFVCCEFLMLYLISRPHNVDWFRSEESKATLQKRADKFIVPIKTKFLNYTDIQFEVWDYGLRVFPADEKGFQVTIEAISEGYLVKYYWMEHIFWNDQFKKEDDAAQKALDIFCYGLADRVKLRIETRGHIDYRLVKESLDDDEWIEQNNSEYFLRPLWQNKTTRYVQNDLVPFWEKIHLYSEYEEDNKREG